MFRRGPGLGELEPARVDREMRRRAERDEPNGLPEYDWDEIRRHDQPGDYWIAFGGFVYDVSEWIHHHPGGPDVFISNLGRDATEAYLEIGHSEEAVAAAESFRIGRLRQEVPVAAPADQEGGEALEIPYAVRWLVPRGERFANFDVLNDNDTQLDYYRRFGHIYAVGIPTKKWRIVVVSAPELLDEVASNEEQFGKTIEEINFFDQLRHTRGDGLSVIGDGEAYERIRRVMLPWYAPANQKTQFGRMKEQARRVIEAWAKIPDSEPIEVRSWMERYALEVSGRGACNYDFGLLDGDGQPRPFAAAVPESTKESIARIGEARPDSWFAGRTMRARRKRYRRQNEELFNTADALVRGRVHTCPLGEQTDLLTRLLTVPDPESGEYLAVEAVRDQVLMHLSNGFNGPSITGAWLAYVLATHPGVEEKLIAEIDAVTGGDPDYDLQYEDLMKLPYMTQVIKETLRIYPPMPITVRRSLKDGMLGRYRVRKGDIIFVGTLAAQRDPRYWGPDPDAFDPEHFAMEKVVGRPRHAFIPFSIGKRQCMAQEVSYMMLRVVLFAIYNRYRLRLPAGATVTKNTVVTTKPVAVPAIRLRREERVERQAARARRHELDGSRMVAPKAVDGRDWDRPSEIPQTSHYRHLVVAYGSNFGTSKGLAERFAERSHVYGFTSEVMTLNELVEAAPRTQPWLLIVMTPTYTSNPPSNAIAFKAWLEHGQPGTTTWRNCRYLVWGLGNSQWNAFLAFPRYVNERLSELGATPVTEFAFADVGSPTWEQVHTQWNDRAWPTLIKLAGARPTEAAAARIAAERAAAGKLMSGDSATAMARSLHGGDAAPRVLLAPVIMTNTVGIETFEARVVACRELQAPESGKRTRHLEVSLPADVGYTAGDHLGICPKNDEDRVEKLAKRLGSVLDGLFMVPKSMDVQAVPKGVVLQVRNVLTNLVDIAGMPTVPLLELLITKAVDPVERARLEEIRDVLQAPEGPPSILRDAVRAGGYDVLQLLEEFPSCGLNVFEYLQVAQPLRPRYYSTSSSPRIHGDRVAQVAVGLERIPVADMPEREFCGMCARYVHSLREGDRINLFLESADGFHLQEDVSKPMVLVSAGTGFAPMRAFLWERLAMKGEGAPLGEAALFNGIRSSRLDYIYREEIESFVDQGVLEHLFVAMSREAPDRRVYVQDLIREQGELVWAMLQAGGYVYVCGSQPMREGVRSAFVDMVAEHGSMPREHAEAYMHELETTENRYRPDLWG